MLICPHCGESLLRVERAFRCPQGHSFDCARAGYVNLLRRTTKLPSDTKGMLLARRRFLARGFYAPLAEAIGATVGDWLSERGVASGALLDAGCGEGYYTRWVAHALAARNWAGDANDEQSPRWRLYGLDLSRDGIDLAARQSPTIDAKTARMVQVEWVVGNIKDQLPFADASLNVIINCFSPHNAVAFAQALCPGGLLLVIIPFPDHLETARSALGLLAIEREKQAHLTQQLADAFTLAKSTTLSYPLTLDADAQRDLRQMAPSAQRRRLSATATTGATAGARSDTLVTHPAFSLLRYVRHAE